MKSCMRWTIPDNSFIKHAMNLSWERLRKKNLSKLCQAKWPLCFFWTGLLSNVLPNFLSSFSTTTATYRNAFYGTQLESWKFIGLTIFQNWVGL